MKTKKYLTLAEYSLPIEIQREDDGYVARCPVWSDCFAQGDTIDEAINEISYVASSLIELYKEEDLEIPLKLKGIKENKSSFFKIDFPLVVSAS
ncbi:MAG: type II toxin-antitoxin system HicB family antitoxin [Patescibacteria group bacterium]